jgi:hypothetical protein
MRALYHSNLERSRRVWLLGRLGLTVSVAAGNGDASGRTECRPESDSQSEPERQITGNRTDGCPDTRAEGVSQTQPECNRPV